MAVFWNVTACYQCLKRKLLPSFQERRVSHWGEGGSCKMYEMRGQELGRQWTWLRVCWNIIGSNQFLPHHMVFYLTWQHSRKLHNFVQSHVVHWLTSPVSSPDASTERCPLLSFAQSKSFCPVSVLGQDTRSGLTVFSDELRRVISL